MSLQQSYKVMYQQYESLQYKLDKEINYMCKVFYKKIHNINGIIPLGRVCQGILSSSINLIKQLFKQSRVLYQYGTSSIHGISSSLDVTI